MPEINQPIKQLFSSAYNQASWKQFLGEVFANTQLLSSPEELRGIDDQVVEIAKMLGVINLDENGVERQIALYEVTLEKGIILERNRVGLRNVLRKYWKNIDAALIVYHRPEDRNWRLTYVSELTGFGADGEFVEIKTEPKRYTYVLGEGETVRTAVGRFEKIQEKGRSLSLDDVKDAFSVEKLSKVFFDEYKRHYEAFCKYMTKEKGISQTLFNGDEKAIRDFNKKLLGRVVFLYFIQKKGWLGVPVDGNWGDGDFNFLTNLFEGYGNKELFYQEILSRLFFDTLNRKRDRDLVEINGKHYRIPYLNGGLFEEDKHRNIVFSADQQLFEKLFEFFNQYNFTIYEDDPNDHTVAVDPEMLGHIFENLLEDNKDKGAFYTPKEIVHYMCQESLIEYLTTWFENNGYKVVGFVTIAKPEQPSLLSVNTVREGQLELEVPVEAESNTKQINRVLIEKLLKKTLNDDERLLVGGYADKFNVALDAVKICDPAIGSGAFPMGLLHEIFTAKQTLYGIVHGNANGFAASEVKLNIIQNSIYGVDIERGAVDIARLRFWLSLIVDEGEPKPLPNLDYKIVVGNSLVSKLDDQVIDLDWGMKGTKQTNILIRKNVLKQTEILERISQEQKEFFSPDSDKKKLAADIRNLKIDLLINQLKLMIESEKQEFEPKISDFKDKKKFVKATEQYYKNRGWQDNIVKLKNLKADPKLAFNFFDWKLDFPEVMNEKVCDRIGFDIVIGNPPYDVLDNKKKISELEQIFRNPIYEKAKGGKINLYRLFLAKSTDISKKNAVLCQIFQNSFLADTSAKGIRKYFLDSQNIIQIDSFPERDNVKKRVFESVKMSICILFSRNFVKAEYDFTLNIWADKRRLEGVKTNFSNTEVLSFDKDNFIILSIDKKNKALLKKLNMLPKLSEIGNCWTGEIDLTIQKPYLREPSDKFIKMIKGAAVQKWEIREKMSQGIVQYLDSESYLRENHGKKSLHHKLERIVMQGISGVDEKYRLKMAFLNKDVFCGNSVNYILLENDDISSKYVLSLMNSVLLNWYFKIFSTNSNVNGYEVNNLPVPQLSSIDQQPFIILANQILSLKSEGKDTTALEKQIDNLVYKLYELTYQEVKAIDPEFKLTESEYEAIKIE